MKYVLFWIEMLKISAIQTGQSSLLKKDGVDVDRYYSRTVYCDYRLKKAIRQLNDERIRTYIDDASEADQLRQ